MDRFERKERKKTQNLCDRSKRLLHEVASCAVYARCLTTSMALLLAPTLAKFISDNIWVVLVLQGN
jgi:hypothetical protein